MFHLAEVTVPHEYPRINLTFTGEQNIADDGSFNIACSLTSDVPIKFEVMGLKPLANLVAVDTKVHEEIIEVIKLNIGPVGNTLGLRWITTVEFIPFEFERELVS